MFIRHQLYQLYEEGREPTVRLIESLLDYIEELKHDPRNGQQRHIADLSERIGKLWARLKRVAEKLEKQLCLNYELKRRIAELEAASVVRDSHNSSLPPAPDPPAAKAANALRRTRSLRRPSGRLPGGQPGHQENTRRRVDQEAVKAERGRRRIGQSEARKLVTRLERCRAQVLRFVTDF